MGDKRGTTHLYVLAVAPTSRRYGPEGWYDAPVPRVVNITGRVALALGARCSRTTLGLLGWGQSELVRELSLALHGTEYREGQQGNDRPGESLGHERL